MELPAACALDADGQRRQAERYAEIGRHVIERSDAPLSFTVRLADSASETIVAEAIRVERECCPFFAIDYSDRTLAFAVANDTDRPALDAVRYALGLSAS